MITFPNAKINLGLNIVEKRPDGYHNLETVFYPIPVEDALEVNILNESPQKFRLHQAGLEIAGEAENNLVVKAYKLLDERFNLPPIDIHLFKHIPSGAGLGGGSSDAAYMLKLLNEKFNLELSDENLEEYAAKLGADCAFFIRNTPTYAEGIGNIFSPISLSLKGYQIVLVKPDIFVSTRDAFAQIKPHRQEIPLKEVIKQPIEEWKERMVNDFEESVFPQFPAIREIKEKLYEAGAIYAAMTGSGSSVFGLFRPEDNKSVKEDFGEKAFVYQGALK
ncbi:4-diphosphocytidyl-2-C-methyl-D-erythritol kinase [Bacteroides intestinalis CAG:315]|jgi:4-diphosphocytidyl-2-C-methyl-D-erythritol kinase|uniref:4-diphosphocytidyl-2-C-methyl-D-erythritol kinase n=1 Tax=Bacteroides intestinalis TaxID=329854 RepID=A0A412XZ38_9BACE|nr:4-(cytidine 5'-diphospho)-2-C-methyl-D-erythritol kinase [Bacteroides intestinalis]RGV50600.1 4-(cytidine 5'-diphospho)-2-C-methyl-D-erythritol kinase [Bacteroides intestinalis]CDD91094.1 4-diphosphocytidyl-2-C-methyl-D-erythritol kinase [Bacteroides intestinalis CAG:315]